MSATHRRSGSSITKLRCTRSERDGRRDRAGSDNRLAPTHALCRRRAHEAGDPLAPHVEPLRRELYMDAWRAVGAPRLRTPRRHVRAGGSQGVE
jgi:hypothetical protein